MLVNEHTTEDDLEVFTIEDPGLDWISAHNFLTRLQKLYHKLLLISKFLSLLQVVKKDSFSSTSGHDWLMPANATYGFNPHSNLSNEYKINKLAEEYMDHIDRGKRRNKITGDFLRLPLKIYPIEGCQFCKVPMTKGKFCKVEVLCIVEDIDECHILLGRAWRCEVNGKYDVKRNLYLFLCERRRIAMVQPKVTPKLPNPKVKVEDKIVKAAVVEDHIEKIQDLQSYKKHDDKISTLSFGTTNKVGTLKTCEEIMCFNDDKNVKGFNYELKMDYKCVHDLNIHNLDYG
nr:putative nucleotidyltransferase, ribonuclease H [Tanacetum cinerariifolium]